MISIGAKLELLREKMRERGIDLYLVPSIDAHNSEYVPNFWQRRSWISGFDGSAGEVLITLDNAYLWTDGRYFLQAEAQLDASSYTLMRQSGFVPELKEFLSNHAIGKNLGVDAKLLSITRARQLGSLMDSVGGEFLALSDNLIDECRLELNDYVDQEDVKPGFILEDKYTGLSIASKLQFLCEKLKQNNVDYIVLNVLDEIAWLLNLRGYDVDYNPLVISYLIVGRQRSILFVEIKKLDHQSMQKLNAVGIDVLAYDEFDEYLKSLKQTIWLDAKTSSQSILMNLSPDCDIFYSRSPIVLDKACKNLVEQDGARVAHIKDAVAVISFLSWLDSDSGVDFNEIYCADRLFEFRAKQANFFGLSFATISGFGSNGAIIHYRATPQSCKKVDRTNMYLIDSGGQYLEGTTDITRTIHLGQPTLEQKRHYTLVLKGHLALARAIFPEGTHGEHLDALARLPLWGELLDYRHGTGHGVGSFLCVHEGPQRISRASSEVALKPGMIVSNEPGLYLDGSYGIRIENLCLIKVRSQDSQYGNFYQFENLTLVPYAKKLLLLELLDSVEINQIKDYYAQIKLKIRHLLSEDVKLWLDNELDF